MPETADEKLSHGLPVASRSTCCTAAGSTSRKLSAQSSRPAGAVAAAAVVDGREGGAGDAPNMSCGRMPRLCSSRRSRSRRAWALFSAAWHILKPENAPRAASIRAAMAKLPEP